MDPEVDRAREEAAQWLAKLERGLRGTEGASLREWAREPANRAAIVDIARSWHGPEVLAILAEIFPINRPMAVRTSRGSAASLMAVAASIVVVVLAAWMLIRAFHETVERRRHRIDYAGAALLTGGMTLLILAVLEG